MTLAAALERNTLQRPGYPPRSEIIRILAPSDCADDFHSAACAPRVTLSCAHCSRRANDCTMTLALVTVDDDSQYRTYYCARCAPRLLRRLVDVVFDGFKPYSTPE